MYNRPVPFASPPALIEARNEADTLIYTTEKSIRDLGDKVDGELKSDIEGKTETLKKAMEGEDVEAITKANDELAQSSTCGCREAAEPEPYYIHQVIELPEIEFNVSHIILYRGRCAQCASMNKALIPREQRSGYGPRLSAMIAEMVGMQADSRRAVQSFLASVLGLPISLGGIQKVLGRVSAAIEPHYEAISEIVHNSPVNHVDETSWRRKGKLTWLWVMGNAFAAFFKVHDERSKKAFEEFRAIGATFLSAMTTSCTKNGLAGDNPVWRT